MSGTKVCDRSKGDIIVLENKSLIRLPDMSCMKPASKRIKHRLPSKQTDPVCLIPLRSVVLIFTVILVLSLPMISPPVSVNLESATNENWSKCNLEKLTVETATVSENSTVKKPASKSNSRKVTRVGGIVSGVKSWTCSAFEALILMTVLLLVSTNAASGKDKKQLVITMQIFRRVSSSKSSLEMSIFRFAESPLLTELVLRRYDTPLALEEAC